MKLLYNKHFSSVAYIFEELKKADSSLHITYSHPQLSPANAYADNYIQESYEEGYIDRCKEWCEREKIDLFFPQTKMAEFFDEDFGETKLILPVEKRETFDLIENKAAFSRFLIEKGVGNFIGDFELVQSFEEFNSAFSKLNVKHELLCIKPNIAVFAQGFKVIKDHGFSGAEFIADKIPYHIPYDALIKLIEPDGFASQTLLMEFLVGEEFSVDCFFDEGELFCATVRIKQGYYQHLINYPELLDAVREISKCVNLNNLVNFQFKKDKKGEIKLLEINTRMSGGIIKAMKSGINYPRLPILKAQNRLTKQTQNYDVRVFEEIKPIVF